MIKSITFTKEGRIDKVEYWDDDYTPRDHRPARVVKVLEQAGFHVESFAAYPINSHAPNTLDVHIATQDTYEAAVEALTKLNNNHPIKCSNETQEWSKSTALKIGIEFDGDDWEIL